MKCLVEWLCKALAHVAGTKLGDPDWLHVYTGQHRFGCHLRA